jgi:hypothetical protein
MEGPQEFTMSRAGLWTIWTVWGATLAQSVISITMGQIPSGFGWLCQPLAFSFIFALYHVLSMGFDGAAEAADMG